MGDTSGYEAAGAGLCCNVEDYIALAEIIRGFALIQKNIIWGKYLKYIKHFGKNS